MEHRIIVTRDVGSVVISHATDTDTADPSPALQIGLADGDTVVVEDHTTG